MSTVSEILRAVREVVVMNEGVIALSKQVDKRESHQADLRDRVVRIEAFIDMVRPAITRRALPPSSGE